MNTYKISDLDVGLGESFVVKLDARKMDLFLEMVGDTNPMHLYNEYAEKKGFKGRLVYGLLTSSFYSTLVGVYLPGKYCILHEINIRFSKPVYIEDTLLVEGKVSHINEAFKQVEIKAVITNSKHEKVSKATIKVGVMDE